MEFYFYISQSAQLDGDEHVSAPPSHVEDTIFAGDTIERVPTLTDRYDYKKEPGHADTAHTSDEIKT
ncbi:hypothetical protein [Actinomadura atramentaria]|uniref:hypothetical protein n=1 Tax=Actinomadura atramentaria TaxID=1990 RepID=UPI00035E1331|nr:hypothetical protein [Actinomadura atramentaria]